MSLASTRMLPADLLACIGDLAFIGDPAFIKTDLIDLRHYLGIYSAYNFQFYS